MYVCAYGCDGIFSKIPSLFPSMLDLLPRLVNLGPVMARVWITFPGQLVRVFLHSYCILSWSYIFAKVYQIISVDWFCGGTAICCFWAWWTCSCCGGLLVHVPNSTLLGCQPLRSHLLSWWPSSQQCLWLSQLVFLCSLVTKDQSTARAQQYRAGPCLLGGL